MEKQSGYLVVLIFKAKMEKYRYHAHLRREIEIQHSFSHPNVLRLYAWFHDETRIFLVLEHAAGRELYKLHTDLKHFSERRAATGCLKIADFGWAMQSNSKRHTVSGTVDYLAPEMIENRAHGHAVDNRTLGVSCFEFLYGVLPFEEDVQKATFRSQGTLPDAASSL